MKFHTEDPQILGAAVQNWVTGDLCTPGLCCGSMMKGQFQVGRVFLFPLASKLVLGLTQFHVLSVSCFRPGCEVVVAGRSPWG